MSDLIFLEPIFVDKIWGGTRLKDNFGYNIPTETTGECWAISGHKNGESIVKNGKYKGCKLSELYKSNQKIFGDNIKNEFPLLVKILDAKDDLSVQVHPNDEYAKENENDLGKTECWYVLDCDDNADIVMGHSAKNKQQLVEMIENKRFDELMNFLPIKKGDFFYVRTGTVHAIRKGTLIYELQQSSDTTYRLYDYDRLENGKPRDLHINKSIDVIYTPQRLKQNDVEVVDENVTKMAENEFFKLLKIKNNGEKTYTLDNKYKLVTVLDGEGVFNNVEIKKGDNFIVPININEIVVQGEVELMVASE